jgi:EmrB/QacA subfamily drug resistance transporter
VSAIGGASVNFAMLVTARACQGAFAALLVPSALSLLTTTFTEPKDRGKAFGVYGAIAAAGGAVGLLLGGLLTEHLNWRWTLYVNLAFAAIGLIGAAAFLRRGDRPAHRPTLDLPGTALVSAGLFLLVFGLSRAQAGGWHAAASWLSLTGAAVLLAAFAGWQARAAAPLLPLRVLADRDRAASIIALTLASAGIYSVFLFLTYYLQTVQAYTPVRTGLAFLPMVATTIAGSVLGANVLLTRIGPRLTLPLGMIASAAGMAWLTRLTVTSSYPAAVLGPLLILGLGLGLIFAPAISLGTARLRGQDTGVGSALVNTTQQVGGAVGIALLSTLAASATTSYLRLHAAITPALQQHAAVHGYTTAYWTATAIFTAGALLTALLYHSGRPDPADLTSTVPA